MDRFGRNDRDFKGKEFLSVQMVKDVLELRRRGVSAGEIEKRLGLAGGVVGRAGLEGGGVVRAVVVEETPEVKQAAAKAKVQA